MVQFKRMFYIILSDGMVVASSLKQQSTGRHVTALQHIILNPSQPVFAITP